MIDVLYGWEIDCQGQGLLRGLSFFISVSTWLVVIKMGVVARLWSFLIVRRLILPGVKFVGSVKCLMIKLAVFLLKLWVMLLNFIKRLGSVVMGSLLFSDLIVLYSMCFDFVYCPSVCSRGFAIFVVCGLICSDLFRD